MTPDRLGRMRQTHKEIVEGDGGECELMADYRWACDEIERLRAVLTDIALDRGKCGPCGRSCDMPSNMTPLDCEDQWIKKCRWDSVDPRERAQEALSK